MPPSREKNIVIYCLLLAAATLVFYNPVVRNQFVDFDDLSYILKNSHVLGGLTWTTVKWSFTTFREGNWHPLTWLSHALDCQVFHLNPIGHHYTNLLLHTSNAILLFLLLQRATGRTWPSLLVAALFALYPTNVESVAWAAERKNVLSMLFFLLALHAYDSYANNRYGRTGRRVFYVLVAICFVLGLLAKPQIVTLPFVLLLWDYWPLQRVSIRMRMHAPAAAEGVPSDPNQLSFRSLLWEKWPLFLLAAADSVVTVIAQRAGAAVRTLSEVSIPARLQLVIVSYVRYIGKALWPSPLVPLYPRPVGSLPAWQVVGAAALLLLLTALVWRWRDRRYLLVGWCWFLGTLVPMIGIITVGEQAMADRYSYLPFIGLFIAAVWTLSELSAQRQIGRAWLAGSAVAVLLVLGSLTYRQLGYWHDSETLWRYTLSVTEGNYTAHSNLALALAKQGRPDEAIVHFHAGKALHKYPPIEVMGLCTYELHVSHASEALEDCNEVLHDSDDPRLQAAAWSGVGEANLQLHRYDQAAQSEQNSLRLNPDDQLALVGMAVLAMRQGHDDVAVALLAHAVKVEPNDVNVLLFVQALRRAGRAAEADSASVQVQKISTDLGQAQFDAGQFLAFVGLKPI